MKALFPPLCDPNTLPRRVLVVAPHADDEVLGAGAMLAFHAARGDVVRVVVLTDGAAGDPAGRADAPGGADLAAARRAESSAAGAVLGVEDLRFLGLADGGLASDPGLVDRLAAELAEFAPELVYGPSLEELHADHRATARALVAALMRAAATSAPAPRLLLYGINAQVTANTLFDTTAYFDKKRAAIERFASQLAYHDMVAKAEAADRARTVNIDLPDVKYVEGFADLGVDHLARYAGGVAQLVAAIHGPETDDLPAATAVISTWNKRAVVLENLDSIRAQTRPFAAVVVVDNASTDGTAEAIAERYPEVTLIRMPHSAYGACETFNIGFASVTTPLTAILDDDVTLPPDWLERATKRLLAEPETTAVLSTEVIEPGMPESYIEASARAGDRYMSTFRGCGSLAKSDALKAAGYYDVRLFIYGNERDLTCRLLNLGYRVLQHPPVRTYHKTPFGIQMGKRSLYFHARNAWLSMLKYAPLEDLLRMPFKVVTKVLLRGEKTEAEGEVTDATGTIGIGRSLRETPGAPWVLLKAGFAVLWNVPYCLKRRAPVSAPDFELPLD